MLAMQIKATISKTVCKSGKRNKCPYYDGPWQCSLRRQIPAKNQHPDIWIVASDMLFFQNDVFQKAKCVVVDESFFQKGLRGIEDDNEWTVPLAVLEDHRPEPVDRSDDEVNFFERRWLSHELKKQTKNGPLLQETIQEIDDAADYHKGIIREWEFTAKMFKLLGLHPGLSHAAFAAIANKKEIIEALRLSRHMITIWQEIKWMLRHPEVEASGRLRLEKVNGLRSITWRGIEEIHAPYCKLPTLLLDAVLPPYKILEIFHPSVRIVADINARASSHANIQQILGTPTTSIKLDNEENLLEIWRYILGEYLAISRKDTLVICQKKVHEWLDQRGLPKNIAVEHYYDVAGKDIYKNVALGGSSCYMTMVQKRG
jgi:hypothetical protein